MTTYFDSRTNSSNSSSFLYQTQPPSSPVTGTNTNSNTIISQQQQQHPEEKSSDIYFNNDHNIVVDYLVSPKPSTSRIQQTNNSDSIENNSNSCIINTNTNTSSNNKRRSSSSSSSTSMKPIKLANDLTNTKDHVMKRDHFQIKPTISSTAPSGTIATKTTPPTSPLLLTSPKSTVKFEKKKSYKSHKKEKLKEAKNEYEDCIEEYFHQLTTGCGQRDCKNKFCASGRGGILSLQPQAALIMSIQLASMPGSRSCGPTTKHIAKTSVTQKTRSTLPKQQENQPKPFLQSLFSSTPFMGLLNKQQNEKEIEPISSPTKTSHHWSTDFWKLFSHFGTNEDVEEDMESEQEQQQQQQPQVYPQKKEYSVNSTTTTTSTPFDSGYYQIDNDDYRSIMSDSSEDSSGGMLLAISPISVNLDTAVEHLHRAIVTQSITEEKMDTWCRSVFQSWEGIGNSFLSKTSKFTLSSSMGEQQKDINLEELTRFYQLIIHQDRRKDKKSKNPRQVRIMEAISDSLETLLDGMTLNVESLAEIQAMEDAGSYHIRIMTEWCRSIMAVIQWIICCKEKKHKEEQDGFATLVAKLDEISTNQKRAASIASTSQIILTQKLIGVLSKIAQKKKSLVRRVMQNMLASLDVTRMEFFIEDLHQYLLDHYHTGPYKHGLEDTVIMTLKCLELLYQANMKIPSSPVVPPSTFYNSAICKKLNIKIEYRIWKRVLLYGEGRHSTLITRQGETEHQRRSRLFMTTTSTSTTLPYPFENEYQFSWFSYPFLLSPSIKRKIVLIDAMSQMSLEYEDACVNHTLVVHAQKLLSEAPRMLKNLETNLRSATCPYLLLEIRRENFVTDTFDQMSRKWNDLKKPLKVKFIEGGEEGMDQGGVQKEFFGVLFEKLVAPDVGLFSQDESTRLCWIRPVLDHDTRLYEMVGVMMGLSIYNGVIMNLQFPKILWKIFVMPNEALIDVMAERYQLFTLEDLEEGWPDLSSGLRQLLNWDDGEVEDVFCRDYEISMDVFGQGVVTKSLMPNETDAVVPVTNENREQYVKDYCKYFLYTAQKQQILALRRGMWSVIGSRALNLCTFEELEMVACGLRQGPDALDLNMAELESIAEYDDGYNVDHPTIRQFWSVVQHDLTNDQKKQLLLFVTASDRVPVGGLKELSFYIQRNGPDSDRLPTALTCFSRLLLPEYATKQKLRDRLITAIENTKGFGLV
ncbi:unnamed protein product [Mucor hiemalis]